MTKQTKATIVAKIQERTGWTRYKAKNSLKTALESMKTALQMGKEVELPCIGRLVVVERKQKRVCRKNLKGRCPVSVVGLHKRHRRSVRLLGGKDMSENPLPTIIHKNPAPEPVPAKRFAIAIP